MSVFHLLTAALVVGVPAANRDTLPVRQGFGIEATVGYHDLMKDFGDTDENLQGGFGFDVTGSWAWASGLELGAGVGLAYLDDPSPGMMVIGGPINEVIEAESGGVDYLSIFGQVSYAFNGQARVHPFLGGRVGYGRTEQTVLWPEFTETLEESGPELTALGGVGARLVPALTVTGSALLGFTARAPRFGLRIGARARF